MLGGEEGGEADHGGVVGSEGRGGGFEGDVFGFAGGAHCLLEGLVAGHAAAEGDQGMAVLLGRAQGFFDQSGKDGVLEGGGEIGEVVARVFELL